MARSAFISDPACTEQILSTPTDFYSAKPFFDDKHFPRGFRRCGDFTYKEAQLLELHGTALSELANQTRLPISITESQFIDVATGNITATTLLERIWVKYQKLCNGKPFYAVGYNPKFDKYYVSKNNIFDNDDHH